MTSWLYPLAAAKRSRQLLFRTPSPPPWALRSTITDLNMENQPLLDDPDQDPCTRKDGRTSLLPPRRQYMEVPFPEVFEEPGPNQLLEIWQIVRRRKGPLVLIVFLGLLTSLLVTIPQTLIYQARGSIEIQNLNENFLNMRNVSPTADDGGSSVSGSDVQTQSRILQSESLLDRVVAKLNLGKKLFSEEGSGRLSAWRKALGLPEGR